MIQIVRNDVWYYDGVGKPPYCKMIFRAAPDGNTPPDLTATISFDGKFGRSTNTFTISRAAETPSEGQLLHGYSKCKTFTMLKFRALSR